MSPSQWGIPTWIFMHTLAAKIKEEQFPVIGPQVISHLIQICMFLPCPECSDHAKQFWANVNTKNNLMSHKNGNRISLNEYHKAVSIITAYRKQLEDDIAPIVAFEKKIPRKNTTLQSPTEDWDLDSAMYNILKAHRINCVEDLSNLSLKEFKTFRKVGKKRVEELKELIKFFGIKCKP